MFNNKKEPEKLKYPDKEAYLNKNMFDSLLKYDKEFASDYLQFCNLLPEEKDIVENDPELVELLETISLENNNKIDLIDSSFSQILENKINTFDPKKHKDSLNIIYRKLSFNSNQLGGLLEIDHDVDVEEGSIFSDQTVSFDNTTEIIVNAVDLGK
ncbi:hypothetical protein [Mycoplasmopsis felifaucium]|uniref:Uncharacterized protein n=1 Tax=Mycoplasmopsis felifaucium TaxID=35768 RepID=A0ABZ2RSY8_9BACT